MGDPRTTKNSLKFIWTPLGGQWAHGASAGTKALDPHRIQAEERDPSSWLP